MKKRRSSGLILLDRDGTLNELVTNAEHGIVDSPMVPSQIRMVPRAAKAVARLNRAGFGVVIVTNQPAAAKRKTTRRHLEAVHKSILMQIKKAGGEILSSHICFHRAEDRCACRKPRTGLLKSAFRQNPGYSRKNSWMIGDGLTDVQAGRLFGVKTVFIAPHKCDTCQRALKKSLRPTLWADDLWTAVNQIINT